MQEPNLPLHITKPPLQITRLNIRTLLDFYRIRTPECSFVAKTFVPQFVENYKREKIILDKLTHPHILKPIESGLLQEGLNNLKKVDLLIFPEAQLGDLLDYVIRNGPLSLNASKYILNQVIQALIYSLSSQNITHPNLTLQNILLSRSGAILCGWSNTLNWPIKTEQDLIFGIGELAFTFITSIMPFTSKHSKSDPYFKFITPKHIHKFWEQMIKRINKNVMKDFQFLLDFKNFIQELFLGKIKSLQQLAKVNWLQGAKLTEQELQKELLEVDSRFSNAKSQRSKKSHQQQQSEQDIFKEQYQLPQSNRDSSRSIQVDLFIADFENVTLQEQQIPEIPESLIGSCFRLFDDRPKFLVSHLKALFRNIEEIKVLSIQQEIQLLKLSVEISKNIIYVEGVVGWKQIQQEEVEFTAEAINFCLRVHLYHQNGNLLGRLELGQSDLNSFYERRLLQLVKEGLQQHTVI